MTARTAETLAAYALGHLGAAESAEVAASLSSADAERLAKLNALLAVLPRAAGPVSVPPGLVGRTLAAAARPELAEPARPASWVRMWLPSAEVAVSAAIVLVVSALGLTALEKVRTESRNLACQNQLRQVYAALDGYADTHAERYPEVGTPRVPVAGALLSELAASGQMPTPLPAAGHGFAYTLGYRSGGGRVLGLRRGQEREGTPISADLPPATVDAESVARAHNAGQNVLSTGGQVRFAPVSTVGFAGDDIYTNQAGLHRAGLNPDDASLGGGPDVP